MYQNSSRISVPVCSVEKVIATPLYVTFVTSAVSEETPTTTRRLLPPPIVCEKVGLAAVLLPLAGASKAVAI
ncbi:MAG: hypothetical protein G01um101416_703 [Microgenomates group bacterium Gr01-1014_16]|nr:MAG: hypothetical protein G01um101416_703 [Microgenomates group bacterium Gr01-1014_16]